MANLLGDFRDELHSRGARANDRYPLATEIHGFMRPSGRVERVPCEALNSLNVGHIVCGQDPDRCNEKLHPRPATILGLDLPAILLFIIDRRGDPSIELDVSTQVKPVRDIIEVALVLWLTGEMLFPVPFLQ